MNNSKIDQILTEISETENYQIKYENSFENYSEYVKYQGTLVIMLDELKIIIKPIKNDGTIYLTKDGINIISQGGWLKYLENEKEKSAVSSEKEKYDFLSKKWVYKTRILPFILSAIAILFSILTFLSNLNRQRENKNLQEEVEKMKLKMEKEVINKVTKPNG